MLASGFDFTVMGEIVKSGQTKQGTPMCGLVKNSVEIEIVTSTEEQANITKKRPRSQVCVKMEPIPGESPRMHGRHFEATDILVSKTNGQSIDTEG